MSDKKVADENGGDDEEEYVIVDKPVEEIAEEEAPVEEAVDEDERLANEAEDVDDPGRHGEKPQGTGNPVGR